MIRRVERGRLFHLEASPSARSMLAASGPDREPAERGGDPGSGVPRRQGRGCLTAVELLGEQQSLSMPSVSRRQPHVAAGDAPHGGETTKSVFNPKRWALGVRTTCKNGLCYLQSSFFVSTLLAPQHFWSSSQLQMILALGNVCYHGVYFLPLSHSLILQAESTKSPEMSMCLTLKKCMFMELLILLFCTICMLQAEVRL